MGASYQITDGSEGSPIDAVFFGTLILVGIGVLAQRRVLIGDLLRNNPWLAAFFIYCFISVLWSDFPLIASKRWIKTLGHPVMALIILTDPEPLQALRTVINRCSYLLVPMSILLIKYFPEYGRAYDPWTGQVYYQGVALTKNGLGNLCWLLGIFFVWNLLTTTQIDKRRISREELVVSAGFLCMIAWCLTIADSKTSLGVFVVGALVIVVLGTRLVNRRHFASYVVVGLLVAIGADSMFDIYETSIELLGRDPTLTDRTVIWENLLSLQDRPILGFGFESFWLDPRLDLLFAKKLFPRLTQAHNGYIETYLHYGIVGIILLVCMIISVFLRISRELLTNYHAARLKIAWLFAIVLANYTEAQFIAVSMSWTIFYFIALVYPTRYARDAAATDDGYGTLTTPFVGRSGRGQRQLLSTVTPEMRHQVIPAGSATNCVLEGRWLIRKTITSPDDTSIRGCENVRQHGNLRTCPHSKTDRLRDQPVICAGFLDGMPRLENNVGSC